MTPHRPTRFVASRFGIIAAAVAGFAIGAAGFAAAQHDDPAPVAASSDDVSTTSEASTDSVSDMLRPWVLLVAFALAACNSADDGTSASTSTASTTDPIAAVPVPGETAEECADVPDPSRYTDGEIPPIIPPCTAPDDLVIHTIREGDGRAAERGDTLVVDYIGIIIESGEVFDATYTRDEPLNFLLGFGRFIDGWDNGLVGTRAGSLVRLDIPNELAYGDSPPGQQIQPGDALSFYTDVLAVIPSVEADDAPLDLEITPSTGATGLTVDDIRVGDGEVIETGDTVIVHVLLIRGDDESVVYDSWERNDPLQIEIADGESLPGIIEGLQGATAGSLRVLTMPPELAYGPDGNPGLGFPPDTDLIVVADIVGVY